LTVDPEAPEAGAAFSLTLEVRSPRGAVVQMPGSSAPLQPFELLAYTTQERAEGEQSVIEARYRLLPTVAGRFQLGPLRVGLKLPGGEVKEILADPVAFSVQSLLAKLDPPLQDVLPIKGPLPPPAISRPRAGLLLAGSAAALAALAGFVAWRWRRRSLGPPPEPAHTVALRRLQELSHRDLDSPESVEPFFVELSEILRRYLQGRFGAPVMEQTTQEIKRQFDPSEHGPNWTFRLYQLLERMDLVKFARFRISASAAFEDLQVVRALIEEVVARDAEAEAEKARRQKLAVPAGRGGSAEGG
jgi:hypothetical protein